MSSSDANPRRSSRRKTKVDSAPQQEASAPPQKKKERKAAVSIDYEAKERAENIRLRDIEVRTLARCFRGQFSNVPSDAGNVYTVTISKEGDGSVSCVLRADVPEDYPYERPAVSIVDVDGLSSEQRDGLEAFVHASFLRATRLASYHPTDTPVFCVFEVVFSVRMWLGGRPDFDAWTRGFTSLDSDSYHYEIHFSNVAEFLRTGSFEAWCACNWDERLGGGAQKDLPAESDDWSADKCKHGLVNYIDWRASTGILEMNAMRKMFGDAGVIPPLIEMLRRSEDVGVALDVRDALYTLSAYHGPGYDSVVAIIEGLAGILKAGFLRTEGKGYPYQKKRIYEDGWSNTIGQITAAKMLLRFATDDYDDEFKAMMSKMLDRQNVSTLLDDFYEAREKEIASLRAELDRGSTVEVFDVDEGVAVHEPVSKRPRAEAGGGLKALSETVDSFAASTATIKQEAEAGRAAAERRAEAAEDRTLCCICEDAPLGVCFLPCRHLCVCAGCAGGIMDGSRKCPICRADVGQRVDIFLTGAG